MRKFLLALSIFLTGSLMISGQIYDEAKKPQNLPGFDLKRLHFGFTVGLNAMDLAIQRNYDYRDSNPGDFLYADATEVGYGFQVTIVSDLRLSDNWNLRFLPGISFSQISISYYDRVTEELADLGGGANPVDLGPARLEFPLVFKYRSKRENNYRPYLIGGANYRYDLAAKKDYESESNEYVKFIPGSFSLEFGFGVDTYLRYFKFAPELKLSIGMNNILFDEPHLENEHLVRSISRITPFLVMLNFHFE